MCTFPIAMPSRRRESSNARVVKPMGILDRAVQEVAKHKSRSIFNSVGSDGRADSLASC